MKMIVIIVTLLLCTSLLMATDYKIISTKSGKTVTVPDLAKDLKKYDVIYFGEFHDNATIHQLELEFLTALYAKSPKLIVSLEMFERDTQPYVDMYIKGEMNEEDFLLNSRPWGNYATDYKPLVDFAKAHSLTVVAANVPRPLAGLVVRSGKEFRNQLSERDKAYVAETLNAPDDIYKERFMDTMQATTMHGMPGDESLYNNMYMAQCLKDDTMAESILKYKNETPKSKVVHFNGDFHSNSFLGTVARVQMREPKLKQAVISPVYVKDMDAFILTPEFSQQGTYLIILNEPESER